MHGVVSAVPFLSGEDLFTLENQMDKYYMESVAEFSSNLKGKLSRLFALEKEIHNIKAVLRLRQEGLDSPLQHLSVSSRRVQELAKKKTVEEMLIYLTEQRMITDGADLTLAEIDLEAYLLKRQALLMHKHALSPLQVVGFLFAKEMEIRNVKMLLKSKNLNIDSSHIEKLMVTL